MNTKNPLFLIPLIVAWIGHFLVDIMIGIWPVFKTFSEIDIAAAGIISGLSAFLGEGLQLIFGSLSDKGYSKYLIIGGLIATMSSLCFVYTDNIFILFVLYLITCIGSGAFHPSAAGLVTNIESKNKGLLVGLFTSGGALGMAFSQIIFTYVYFKFDGHVLLLAIPALVLIIFMSLNRVEEKQILLPGKPKKHFNLQGVKNFFKKRELRMLYFTQVGATTMFWSTIFLLPDILVSRGYEFWVAFGGGHMAFVLGSAFMMIPTGMLADRFNPKNVLITALSIGTGLFYLFLFVPILSNFNLLLLLFIMGATIGSVNPLGLAIATRLVPENKGLVSAIMMGLVWCVSEAIGQTGGGLLTKLFENDAPANALVVLGVCFFIAIFTATKLPDSETKLELEEYATE